ncbi:MAG: asparagine synthase (glutamine-hydrolyzing) [Nitrospirae bacterium RBG_13_39_12]|nr:MAG: asparagine synthase (glutamine-hydrolyzing) [Nitrospirae bacterium RBG_13_39_12]
MCGIGGVVSLSLEKISNLSQRLHVMNELQKHRGPDGHAIWQHERQSVGFAHRRLSIIDLTTGQQPMSDRNGNWITYNGEIYNYLELREEMGAGNFITTSDTEVILQAYQKWGKDCVNHLRGMFAFALWDETNQVLFCARDRFGIKPFYYTVVDGHFYFASEIKALLPFVKHIETDPEGLADYLIFQFCMAGKTLFKGIYELLPGHFLRMKNGSLYVERYWEVYYYLDFDHTAKYFEENLKRLLLESIHLHLRSDVPVGTYLSGGLDSSTVTSLASRRHVDDLICFHGKFSFYKELDESLYAHELAYWCGLELHEIDITVSDFIQNIRKVIYHMDYPAAGPGSFPQYMVSKYASRYRKVLLGGQGGDEIFGGYARYLIAYFEQCIKAAIDGTIHSGNFIVTYESIIPNLTALRNYKPLLKEFWREGLFEEMDRRYFRLINRASLIQDEVKWELLRGYSPFETFCTIFNGNNVRKESYFDLMTHFDFKTLLPALLQVEDRVSMAHGVESRVPFLDHPLVEFSATIPSNIKFKDGTMKQVLKAVMKPILPGTIIDRKDKMGFPVPLTQWIKGEAKEFIYDIFSSEAALSRDFIDNRKVINGLTREPEYGRKIWGMLCLELWQQEFHDKESQFKELLPSSPNGHLRW